jgi:hypothetical protein
MENKMNISTVIGYIGSVIMVFFAFTMLPSLAILGLSLLTVQAVDSKLWNLVILNLVSIGGFATQLIGA